MNETDSAQNGNNNKNQVELEKKQNENLNQKESNSKTDNKDEYKNKSKKKKFIKYSIYFDEQEFKKENHDLRKIISDKINENYFFIDNKEEYIDLDNEDILRISNDLKINQSDEVVINKDLKNKKEEENIIKKEKSENIIIEERIKIEDKFENQKQSNLITFNEKKEENYNKKEGKDSEEQNKLIDMSINIKRINKPLQNCEKIETIGDLDIYLYKSVELSEEEKSQAITLMVIGGTEAGKTTFLNSYLNYLLGVQLTDKFRYKIINEVNEDIEHFNNIRFKSRTTKVTAYNIRRKNGKPIIMIDTTGFIYYNERYDRYENIDSNIINFDINTIFLIRDFLINQISTINAICFVFNDSYNQYFSTLEWRFDNMLNLFADNIKENIIIMANFSDFYSGVNYILKREDCIFNDVIPYLQKDDLYFQFNNSIFFTKYENEAIFEMFWKMNIKNYEKFTNKIERLQTKNLELTKQVLDERAKLENNSNNLINKFDNFFDIMNIYKSTLM